VVDLAPSGGAFGLGIFLFVARMRAQRRSSLYYSGITYTTVRYGDLVLAKP
jgi:hypothetical protein